MSIQLASGGRRILWLAHESVPKNFTGVDVTDPSRPKVVVQTDLPHEKMRSNSLEVVGDVMAVAYQVAPRGLEPAGLELFDLSTPENPRPIGFFDCSGPHSRGVHQLWFVDGEYLTCAAGAADFTPRISSTTSPFGSSTCAIRPGRRRSFGGGSGHPRRRCRTAGAAPSSLR